MNLHSNILVKVCINWTHKSRETGRRHNWLITACLGDDAREHDSSFMHFHRDSVEEQLMLGDLVVLSFRPIVYRQKTTTSPPSTSFPLLQTSFIHSCSLSLLL